MKRWIPLFIIAGLAGFGWWLRPEAAAPPVPDSAAPGQTEYVLAPSQDTFIALGIDDPVGHLGQLRTGFDSVEHWTYIQWDTPEDLGEGATVTHVALELYCTDYKLSRPVQNILEGGIPNRGWDEDVLTWRTKTGKVGPLWRWTPGPCEKGSASGVWMKIDSDVVPDLIDIVQGWIDEPDDNDGLMLVPVNPDPGEDMIWDFRSGDNELPPPLGKGPRLSFTVADAVTPTFTPSITPTPSDTPIPSDTPTPTATFTPSATPTATATPTNTPTITPTPTPRPIYAPLVMRNYVFGEDGEPTPDPAETPEPPATGTPEPDIEIQLEEQNESGAEGSAAPWQVGEGVEVLIGFAPMLVDAHPADIVEAESCDALGDDAFELSDVVDGASATTFASTALSDIADGSSAVVIRAASDDETVVACGMLPEYTTP